MRLISGSILIGFSLVALVLDGFGGGSTRMFSDTDWYVRINIPIGLEILIWVFMAIGVGLIVWESRNIGQANKKGGKK